MPKGQTGSALLIILLVIGVLVVAAFLLKSNFNPQNLSRGDQDFRQSVTQTKAEWPLLWGPPNTSCQDKESVKFSALPLDVKDIIVIEPMGELREGHIIPGDHIGIEYKTSPRQLL